MTKQILAFLFCFIRELNPQSPLISILPPTYPPIPPPIHDCAYGALITFDCAYGALITLFCECKTPAGGRQYIYRHPPLRPYLGNVAKLIRRRRISLKRDNHPKNPSVKSILNSTYYKQVVKRLKGKTLYYYIQECLSVQNVKIILYSC